MLFFIINFDHSCIINFHRIGMCIILFNSLWWKLGFIDFGGKNVNHTFHWLFLCALDVRLRRGDAVWFSSRWGCSPRSKSSSLSWARTPICAMSMSVEMHTSLKSFYAMWFAQFREIMKHSTTFIVMFPPLFYLYQLYPIVHYPIFHILRRE